MSAVAMRQVGERIPGRIARVRQIRLEQRDGRGFVYVLTNSLRGPRRKREVS
jgi:hypothetical protein